MMDLWYWIVAPIWGGIWFGLTKGNVKPDGFPFGQLASPKARHFFFSAFVGATWPFSMLFIIAWKGVALLDPWYGDR